MTTPPSDTSRAATAVMISGLRRMTGAERLAHALMLSHPNASEREWRARLAKRRIDDLAVPLRVFIVERRRL